MYVTSPAAIRLGNPYSLGLRFRPGKALRRAVHITPKSFTLKRIMGAVGSLTATIATGGLGPIIAPKIVSANSKAMQTLGMIATSIAVVAGGVVLGPAIASTLGPTLSSAAGMLGKGVESLTGFFNFFNRQTPATQQRLAQTLTPEQVAGIDQGTLDPTPLLQATQAVYRQPRQPAFTEEFAPPTPAAGVSGGPNWTTIALIGGGYLILATVIPAMMRK